MSKLHQARAVALQRPDTGPAYWRVAAVTDDGQFFTKLPLLDPTSGHDGPWREFIALRLAALVGLPVLQPIAVEVPTELVPASAPPLFFGAGNTFCGTPFCENLEPGDGYGNLSAQTRALLYVFDNFIHNSDRAGPRASRNDCWLLGGRPIVLDFDVNCIGSDVATNYFAWFGDFLVHGLGSATIATACRQVSLLINEDIAAVVREAASLWTSVDAEAASEWIRSRRDELGAAFLSADRDPLAYSAWKQPAEP